jgi:DNA primase
MSDRRIPDAVLAEIRARLPIESVVGRGVKLTGAGSGWRKGLCPFHHERNPSFTVRPAERTYHCFGCGAHGDVIRFVQLSEGLAFLEAVRRCAAEAGLDIAAVTGPAGAPWAQPMPAAAVAPAPAAASPAERSGRAWQIWNKGEALCAGSPQAQYLAGRGLWPLPAACHAVLRGGVGTYPERGPSLHPLLLARVDGPDGTFRAVHRTWLGRNAGGWGKLGGVGDPRRSLGPLKGNAIRLFSAAARMGVAEGIETALSAHLLAGVPVWSCLNASALAAVEVPMDVQELVIFADRDRPRLRAAGMPAPEMPEGAGIFYARRLAERMQREGVRVEIRAPRDSGDYADLWMRARQLTADVRASARE